MTGSHAAARRVGLPLVRFLLFALPLCLASAAPQPASGGSCERLGATPLGFDELYDLVLEIIAAEREGRWSAARRSAETLIEGIDSLEEEARRAWADSRSIALHAIARERRETGDPIGAIRLLDEPIEQFVDMNPGYRSQLLSLRGLVLLELGLPDRAADPIDRAVQLSLAQLADFEANVHGAEVAMNWAGLFNAHLRQANQRIAISRYREAAEGVSALAERLDWDRVEQKIGTRRRAQNLGSLHCLAGIARSNLDDEGDKAAGRRAFDLVLEIEGARPEDRIQALGRLVRLDLADRDHQAAERRLDALEALLSELAEAASVRDLAWAAALRVESNRASGLPIQGSVDALDEAMELLVASWQGSIRPGGVGRLRYRLLRSVVAEWLSLGTPEEAVQRLARVESCGLLWERLGRPQPDLADLRNALVTDDSGCLVFFPGDRQLVVLAIGPSDSKCPSGVLRAIVEDHRIIREQAREFMIRLRTPPGSLGPGERERRSRELSRIGEGLTRGKHALLPAEIRDVVSGWSTVRVVGRESLEGLAFEALELTGEVPFGRRHAVTDLPATVLAPALASAGTDRGHDILCLGAPGDAADDRYPEAMGFAVSNESWEALTGAYRASNPLGEVLVRTGPQATVGALRACSEQRFGVLHVLAHGIRDRRFELEGRLLLAADGSDDGILEVSDLRDLEAPPIVILSACNGSAGPPRPGDAGSNHLGGAFLMGGARSVVGHADRVRLGTALAVSERLFVELGNGVEPAEAARRVRDWMARTEGFEDPFHWGLLQVLGL